MRAYWLAQEGPKQGDGSHVFQPEASFEEALALYVFDRKLRLLVMDAIERVEVSLRTQWAHGLALRYGAHAYLNPALFKSSYLHQRCLAQLQEEVGRSQETFIEHYRTTYSDPAPPPLWAACEVMSFGQLSKWVGNLKFRADRQTIASVYNLDERILVSFLHHLTTVRNLCAHHARLWNRRFTITMQVPREAPHEVLSWFHPPADRNLYNTLVMLGWFLRTVSPGSSWAKRVTELVQARPQTQVASMGFPADWKRLTLWSAPPSSLPLSPAP